MVSKYDPLVPGVRELKPGEAYVAEKGVDFTCEPDSFRAVVYWTAARKGARWRGTAVVVGRRVVYTYYKRDGYSRPNLPAYPLVKKLRGEE
jgi:hypothetical protein